MNNMLWRNSAPRSNFQRNLDGSIYLVKQFYTLTSLIHSWVIN